MIRVQRSLIIAAAVFANASIIFGGALVRALTTESVQPPAKPAVVSQPELNTDLPGVAEATPPTDNKRTRPAGKADLSNSRTATELDIDDLMLAVDHDPFRPERQRPGDRYRLPGEEIPDEPPPPPQPTPPPMRVLATAVMPSGGIALVQVQESLHRVLSVGESVLGYTLASVGPGTARLEGNAGSVVLRVDEPQPNRPRTTRNARGAAGGGRGANPAAARELEARAAQMRDAIEMLRANGGNPQQIRQLIEAMSREMENIRRNQNTEVIRSNQAIEIQPGPNRDRIMVRPRPDTLMSRN